MRIAIITFDGFNEIDAFVPLGLLNRQNARGWKAEITGPTSHMTSMNGVTVQAQQPLEFANEADAVIFGSGIYTRVIAEDIGRRGSMLDRLHRGRYFTLDHRSRCTRRRIALPRTRPDRHCGWLLSVAIPRRLDDGQKRGPRCGCAGVAPRRAGG